MNRTRVNGIAALCVLITATFVGTACDRSPTVGPNQSTPLINSGDGCLTVTVRATAVVCIVPAYRVIVDPMRFDGRSVRVIGVLHKFDDRHFLTLTKDAPEHTGFENAVELIELSSIGENIEASFLGRSVSIEGVVDGNYAGKLPVAYALKDILSIQDRTTGMLVERK